MQSDRAGVGSGFGDTAVRDGLRAEFVVHGGGKEEGDSVRSRSVVGHAY